MGSFFTNVQVQTRDAERVLALVSKANGYRAPREGETPDRTIVVRSSGEWTSVYDELTEGQDRRVLDALAATLSKELKTRALTVLVHDSDVLLLSLFEGGKARTRHDSNPGYFGGKAKKQKPEPEKWAPLLAPGHTRQDLDHVLSADDLMAEDTLARFAVLIGVPPRNAGIGYRYREPEAGDRVVQLRLVKRPTHEQKSEGAPRFEMGAHSLQIDLSLGSPASTGFSVRNAGGASRGVDVCVASPMVRPLTCELVVGNVLGGSAVRLRAAFEGGVARFPDIDVPAGAPMSGFQPGVDPRALVDAMHSSTVHANIEVEALGTGEGAFAVRFVPHGAPDAHAFIYDVRIRCVPASRRPLRARPDVNAHELRQLDESSHLYALVSSALPKAEAAAIARELIPKWGAVLGGSGSYQLGIFRSEPGKRPGTGEAKAKGFFESARWKKLQAELSAESMVTAEKEGGGFSFGDSVLPTGKDLCPTLGLWTASGGPGARERLVELLAEFVRRARGMQAFIAPWSGWPTLDSTPYETACGVHGQCTMMRTWQGRWLRAATDELWLGPELLARVDRNALETVAALSPCGTAVHVKAKGSLDALETALAPILPSSDDWVKAVRGSRLAAQT